MLREALILIGAGQVTGVDDLATRLGLSSSLAGQLVDDLVRLGYLQGASTCTSTCRSCPLSDGCAGMSQVFALTERGRRAVPSP